MGKKLVIIGFLVCCLLAMWVFWSREVKSLRETLNKDVREPRVVLEDFVAFRYEGDAQVGKLTARLGHFFDPNVMELDGEVKAERQTGDGVETLSTESATAYFRAASVSAMMDEKTELDRAELTGFVEVGMRDHLLSTDFAEYRDKDQTVRSTRPVRVEGPHRVFSGEEGFVYDLKKQALSMPGPIKGVIAVDKP
jgi:lipopolysaccharide export system protein LptC